MHQWFIIILIVLGLVLILLIYNTSLYHKFCAMRGERGETGPRGITVMGPRGEEGKRGDRGEEGKRGDRGEEGKRGDRGERGERGERGGQGTSQSFLSVSPGMFFANWPEEGSDTLKKDSPQKGTPKKGTPKKGTPQKGTPQKGTPQKGTPKKGTPKKGTHCPSPAKSSV